MKRILKYLPGVLLLVGVGLIAKFCSPWVKGFFDQYCPPLGCFSEYVLLAIILGLLIRNVIGVHPVLKPGLGTYELWLKTGIVLLGARFLLQDLAKLSAISLVLVVAEIGLAIAMMLVVGRLFGLGKKLTHLLAVGSSICGVSAIIGAQGAIEADDEDVGFAVAAILAMGALGVFAFPIFGRWIGMSDPAFGVWAGLAIDNTAEVAAGGSLFSEAAGKVAIACKNTRNVMLGFVVLGFALYWSTRGVRQAQSVIRHKGAFIWQKFPKFVLGFFAFCLLSSVGVFGPPEIASLKNLSNWCFLLTFAGVGLQTDFREMKKLGLRPLAVGAICELGVAVVTLGMVLAADRAVGL